MNNANANKWFILSHTFIFFPYHWYIHLLKVDGYVIYFLYKEENYKSIKKKMLDHK